VPFYWHASFWLDVTGIFITETFRLARSRKSFTKAADQDLSLEANFNPSTTVVIDYPLNEGATKVEINLAVQLCSQMN